MNGMHSNSHFVELNDVRKFVREPDKYAHKGTFGHALIAGGSYGKMGAIILSSLAALRTGCGLVTSYVPECGYSILQSSFPESMVLTDPYEKILSTFPHDLSSFRAIGVGMGMGTSTDSQQALYTLLHTLAQTQNRPVLALDADALNILSLKPDWLPAVPPYSILTPHSQELARLIGTWENDFEKLDKTKKISKQYKIIILIKGANTAVVCPDGQVYVNTTGNWGMATAGSGDVLTGVLTSLLAQGLTEKEAALMGVYLHGLAGDLAAQNIHPKSLIASDIVSYLPAAWQAIHHFTSF